MLLLPDSVCEYTQQRKGDLLTGERSSLILKIKLIIFTSTNTNTGGSRINRFRSGYIDSFHDIQTTTTPYSQNFLAQLPRLFPFM